LKGSAFNKLSCNLTGNRFEIPNVSYTIVSIHCKKNSVDNFVKIKIENRWINIKFAVHKIESNAIQSIDASKFMNKESQEKTMRGKMLL